VRSCGDRPTEQVIGGVVEAVREFAAGAPQSDDITALIARYLGDG
jgi:serine phosphatase RsbU (regulator of sigma subunit)